MARTKQSAKRTRATCTSSTPPPQAQQQTSATYPWPREQEGEPIDLDSPLLLDFNCEGWDKGKAARYNALLNFMTMICERRQCIMNDSNKKDRNGSLLTPLFKHFGIDLTKYSVNKEVQYLDIKYLMACHIMRDEETTASLIRPVPSCSPNCLTPRSPAPNGDMEDVEDITPEVESSYDLGELADVTDDQAYRCWMVDSQRKNNSLMRRILHLVTGGCVGGSNHRMPSAE
ncbi:hypothetical protein DY000_02006773 [Brassica cretica]|uniref:Uncharacterized protein n=1 Tax=Brassica cretica TaxID=69181 RepID=A0ABQ7CEH5_BRACR|nr:hypothetical protein DY000_02006773 [Brassica cretica]